MKTSLPQFGLGYHGCDFSLVRELLAGNAQLKLSHNSYDWLGEGIYFWENAPFRAWEWAKECAANPKMTKGKISTPGVVGAIIDLGNCLDLSDTRHLDVVKASYKTVCETYEGMGRKMPENRGMSHKLDCIVINAVEEINRENGYPEFDSIRCPYLEGESIYPGACFWDRTHIQICIRNQECIKGYFLPTEIFGKTIQKQMA